MSVDLKFNDLVFSALDHALDSIKNGGSLVSFVMTENQLHRFPSERIEEGRSRAEAYIEQHCRGKTVAMTYEGSISHENKTYDAIFSKVIDEAGKRRLVIAQRYVPHTYKTKFELIGNPVLVEK